MRDDLANRATPSEDWSPIQFSVRSLLLGITALGIELALLVNFHVPLAEAVVVAIIACFPIWLFLTASSWPGRFGWLLVLVLPQVLSLHGISTARDAACRSVCSGHMCQLTCALQHFAGPKGILPPAYIADASGKPMHSWRVLILPWIDQQGLYNAYNFNEPWDGPSNRKLWNSMPQYFRCPNDPPGTITTSYVAVVGPRTAWTGSKSVKFDEITVGLDKTILLVEVANSGIIWTEPRDLPFEQIGTNPTGQLELVPRSTHRGGFNATFPDFSYHSFKKSPPTNILKAMLTRDGGETVDPKQW